MPRYQPPDGWLAKTYYYVSSPTVVHTMVSPPASRFSHIIMFLYNNVLVSPFQYGYHGTNIAEPLLMATWFIDAYKLIHVCSGSSKSSLLK
jgi:hypothetical protein